MDHKVCGLVVNTLFLLSILVNPAEASSGIPVGGFEVKSLKRERRHQNAAAFLCALTLEKRPRQELAAAWAALFSPTPSEDDKLLVITGMELICPEAMTIDSERAVREAATKN